MRAWWSDYGWYVIGGVALGAIILFGINQYRAQTVNEASGEAARFKAIYEEYARAPDVTRQRLYLETMERVLGGMNKVILDENGDGGTGVVPYLPLSELGGRRTQP